MNHHSPESVPIKRVLLDTHEAADFWLRIAAHDPTISVEKFDLDRTADEARAVDAYAKGIDIIDHNGNEVMQAAKLNNRAAFAVTGTREAISSAREAVRLELEARALEQQDQFSDFSHPVKQSTWQHHE